MMPVAKTCRECGASIPRDAPFGHCPGCLVELGFGPPPVAIHQATPSDFGDYQLLEVIGRGGMGVVYKSRQISLNRLVALKMLTPQSAAFPRVAERLRIEAEAAASLHHSGIVTIHEVGEHGGQPFFTMELVEGSGLDKLIDSAGYRHPHARGPNRDRTREPQASTVRTMVAIARAVDYAHKRGVLHRDLKPANIVIDGTGEPHVTDFGLAKILGRERIRETDSGSVLGTPAYMAPEQAAGETKRVSTAADIYSLGAVFYEMLTGRPPFRGDTPLETLRQVTEEEPKSPSILNGAVDADLATICLKCLDKDPERRYATAQGMADDLDRWLRGEPIEARPVGQLGRFWRWCRREPRLAGMTAGLVALLVASTLLVLALYQRERDRLATERQQRDGERSALYNRIDEEWKQDDRTGVRIYAQEMALLGERRFNLEGGERTIRLGIHSPRRGSNPLQIVQRFAPLVNCLATNLPTLGGVPAMFELHIYNNYSNALVGFRKGETQLMPLSPASCFELRKDDTAIVPLVRQAMNGKPELRMAIFCRADSSVQKLEDLRGRSLVVGLTLFPVMEDWVKAEIWSAGIRASDLANITNLYRGLVVSAVNARRFDVGVAESGEVSHHIKTGVPLRILREVTTPGYLWVGSKDLDPEWVSMIRDRMLAIQDSEVLTSIDENLTGFERASPADWDGVEQVLKKARLFDGAVP